MDMETNQQPRSLVLPLVVLYLLGVVSQLTALALGRVDQSPDFLSILAPSLVFITALTLPSAALGLWLGRRVGLGAPLLERLLSRERGSVRALLGDAGIAVALGLALGALLLLIRHFSEAALPPEILPYGHRGVIGGLAVSLGAAVAEEIWFRLGLMTVLVWVAMRVLGHDEARPTVLWPIILISAAAFGLAHLPQLVASGAGSPFAIGGTVLGNIAVGTLYGWCYWKRSLIAAMAAYFAVDFMIHVLPAFG